MPRASRSQSAPLPSDTALGVSAGGRPAEGASAHAPAERLIGTMGSLADPTRLRLLRLLEGNELGVAELCDILQLPQSTVSRHLKTLAEQGWLVSRREATAHLYRTLLDELDPAKRELWVLARNQTADWATARHDELRLRQVLASRQTGRGFFAGVATDWEEIRQEQYGGRLDLGLALALLAPESVVVDLGCGTGRTMAAVAPHVRQVVGVDASPQMLDAARGRLNGVTNARLLQGELTAVPLPDATCDAAICVLALSYAEAPGAVIGEMARLLRPGGRGVVVDLLAHDRDDFRRAMGQRHRGFAAGEVSRLMTAAGLVGPRVLPLPLEPQAKGPAVFVASGGRPR